MPMSKFVQGAMRMQAQVMCWTSDGWDRCMEDCMFEL